MNNFIKKFIGFSMGPIVGAFISFITIPLTTYFINPSEYGKASMFILFQSIIGTFIYLGMDQAFTREYHTNKKKLILVQNAILIPLLLSCMFFLVTLIVPNKISYLLFEDINYILPSMLFGIMIVFMIFERFILLSIRMEEKAFEYSLLNILVKAIILVATLIFIIFIRRDFLAVVYSTVLGQIIGDIYLIIRYRKYFNIKNFELDKELIRKMILFGFPIVVATSLSSVLNSFDRIALRTWSDYYQIGIFTATLKVSAVLIIIQSSFTSFWVPTAYRWYEEGRKTYYFKLVSDSILLLMSIIFILILIFKDLIILILSSEYYDAKYIIGFLCIQPIIYTVSETTCLGIVFSRKSYLSIWVGIIAIIPNIIINVFFVPTYGAIGAALATSVAYLFFFVARTYFSSRNGIRFPVIKHYFIFILLFIGAVINSYNFKNMMLINVILLISALVLQSSSIKEVFFIFKNKKLNKNVSNHLYE